MKSSALVLVWIVACVPTSVTAQEARTYEIRDWGVLPRPALTEVLLNSPAVQKELKITETQKKENAAILERRSQKVQQARQEIKDQATFRARRDAIFSETSAAQTANFTPQQRERLIQIQLQAQGPVAFSIRERHEGSPAGAPDRFVGPRLWRELKLSDDQVQRVRAIVQEGFSRIQMAASFSFRLDSQKSPTADAVRKLVTAPEFRAAKEKARLAARESWSKVIAQIEAVLSDEQRANYRRLVGKPFDLSTLNHEHGESEIEADVRVASAGGSLGGQRADPGFDVTVAHPAFTSWRPRVAIDEAHHNFHTAGGRYKPFADLMSNDGCLVSPNAAAFNSQTLGRSDILVIVNASAPDRRQNAGAWRSAFAEDEISAVQWWVWNGGSLLLITDHEPFGSASEALAQRFGVLMNTSATRDPVNTDRENGGLLFTRERQLILDHPITIGRDTSERISRVSTFTGQALIGPVGSTPFLRFADTATYRAASDERSAAGWAQGIALSYGVGRVVVMGEAAELSAQLSGSQPMGMNAPGIDNRQMALNIMHWLSRQLDRPTAVAESGTNHSLPRWHRPIPCVLGFGARRHSMP